MVSNEHITHQCTGKQDSSHIVTLLVRPLEEPNQSLSVKSLADVEIRVIVRCVVELPPWADRMSIDAGLPSLWFFESERPRVKVLLEGVEDYLISQFETPRSFCILYEEGQGVTDHLVSTCERSYAMTLGTSLVTKDTSDLLLTRDTRDDPVSPIID